MHKWNDFIVNEIVCHIVSLLAHISHLLVFSHEAHTCLWNPIKIQNKPAHNACSICH
jgi:hypothetical protein